MFWFIYFDIYSIFENILEVMFVSILVIGDHTSNKIFKNIITIQKIP